MQNLISKQKASKTLTWLFTTCLLITFSTFSVQAQDEEIAVVHDATINGENDYRLTTASNNQMGAIWSTNYIDLNHDFEIKADLYFGTKDANGADGMALVFQPNCTGEGSDGGGIGYQGVKPSLGFEFDTWQNRNYGDPTQDHLGIQKNGNTNHNSADALLPKSELVLLGNLEDGKNHRLIFNFNAEKRSYKLSLDGKELLRSKDGQDLFKDVFGEIHHFFWGITAATGASNNEHKVKLIEIPHHDAYPYTIVYPTEETGGKGSITMNIVNGKDPFTYQWLPNKTWTLEPTIEDVKPGLYTVIAKDRVGCLSEFKFRIPTMPSLIGHWTFEHEKELKDLTGNFGDLELKGAKVKNGALDVGKDAWARATNYGGENFSEKTLMAWVKLDDLNMGGGSVLSVDADATFDGIVYAERQAKRWMPGSDYFRRTNNPNPGFEETETGKLIKVAITYKTAGEKCQITIYRNNKQIGQYTKGTLPTYKKGIEALFGIRHSTNGKIPGKPWVDAHIEEARIYDGVLTLPQMKSIKIVKPEYLAKVKEKTVVLGDLVWMTENISTLTCQNGNPIDKSNYKQAKTGVLYNPNAVEECNVCPKGWRLITKDDFKMLGDKGYTKEQVAETLNINNQSLKPAGYLRIHENKAYYGDLGSNIKGGTFTTKGGKTNFHPVRCVGDIKDLNPDAAPKVNNALNFAGDNDYVLIGKLPFYAGSFTVEGMFKGEKGAIFNVRSGTGTAVYAEVTGGKLRCIIRNKPANAGGLDVRSNAVVNDGKWHHFMMVKGDDDKLHLYIDGKLEKSSSNTLADFNTTSYEVVLGMNVSGNTRYFKGTMDYIRFWDAARTPDQSGTANLVADYSFDQGRAGGDNTGISQAKDNTGKHNGTLKNFTLKGETSNFVQGKPSGSSTPAPEPKNVALGKTATQSSTAYGSPASNAVNGVTHGKYASGGSTKNDITHTTSSQMNPWLQVDLGAVYDISKIVIWNRRDCCWQRLKNFYVMVSENPITSNSKSANQFSNGPHAFTKAADASMTISGNKKGRYVRVFIDGKGPLSLAEIEVFGNK